MSGDFLAEVRRRVEAEEAVVVATIVAGPDGVGNRMLIYPNGSTWGSLGSAALDQRARVDYREQLLKSDVEHGPRVAPRERGSRWARGSSKWVNNFHTAAACERPPPLIHMSAEARHAPC